MQIHTSQGIVGVLQFHALQLSSKIDLCERKQCHYNVVSVQVHKKLYELISCVAMAKVTI